MAMAVEIFFGNFGGPADAPDGGGKTGGGAGPVGKTGDSGRLLPFLQKKGTERPGAAG